MSAEFKIVKADPPRRPLNHRKPKCELRLLIEGLKPGQALQWRPPAEHSVKSAYRLATAVRKSCGYKLEVRKVNLGYDIFRTA